MPNPIRLIHLNINQRLLWWPLIIYIFAFWGCAGPETKVDLKKLSRVETILVRPFHHIDDIEVEPVIIDCKLCRQRHAFEPVATDDAVFLSTRLEELLNLDGTYQTIFDDQAKLRSSEFKYDSLVQDDLSTIIRTEAVPRDVDAILLGYIFRFRERVGKSYAIESPASVALSLFLVSLDDGQVIWHSHYEETQEALFSNLLTFGKFIKRKARWVTARELATEALEDMLATLLKP
jgi:hypothetical protein